MSVTKKIYENISRIKTILTYSLGLGILSFVMFSFLGTFNAYAQEATSLEDLSGTTYDSQDVYKESNELINIHTQDDGPHQGNLNAGTTVAILDNIVVSFAPNLSSQHEEIEASNTLSPFSKKGVLGFMDQEIMAMISNPPSMNVQSHLAQEWVPGYDVSNTSAYAADGSVVDGYSFLVGIGIDSLWEKTRLIAYVLFVVVLIVAGFMIMFRQKIGGQLSVTIFNTLPHVVYGLILVTFSFAIVGLVLNASVLLTNVVADFLDPSRQSLIFVNSPFSLGEILLKGEFVGQPLLLGTGAFLGVVGAIVGAVGLVTGGVGLIPALIGGGIALLLFILVVIGIVFYISVKVYITIIKAYVGILLDVVLGPLFLTFGTIPGQSVMGREWFFRVVRNALVFPVVFLFINLGIYILKQDVNIGFPAVLTNGTFEGANTDMTGIGWLLRAAMTLVFFMMASQAPNFINDILPPQGGGKGTEAAFKALSGIPVIGGFFG